MLKFIFNKLIPTLFLTVILWFVSMFALLRTPLYKPYSSALPGYENMYICGTAIMNNMMEQIMSLAWIAIAIALAVALLIVFIIYPKIKNR